MDLGILPVRHLFFGGVGMVHAFAAALSLLAAGAGAAHGAIATAGFVGRLRPSGRLCGTYRAVGADCDSIPAGARLLAALPRRQALVPAGMRCRRCDGGGDFSLDDP